jgi:hypothetical protein
MKKYDLTLSVFVNLTDTKRLKWQADTPQEAWRIVREWRKLYAGKDFLIFIWNNVRHGRAASIYGDSEGGRQLRREYLRKGKFVLAS